MSVEHGPGDVLPSLSRGRHRSPRKGACFMELASFLAGERWSDHPRCTHRLLSGLARAVNDASSDATRPRLARLVPSVIGLDSDDPHWDVEIALRAVGEAIPVVRAERQNVLAVGLLTCERVLDILDERPPGTLRPQTRLALDSVPAAARWAEKFSRDSRMTVQRFRSDAAPVLVTVSVEGIAEACISDADDRLEALLEGAIEECRTWAGMLPLPGHALAPEIWLPVCRPAALPG